MNARVKLTLLICLGILCAAPYFLSPYHTTLLLPAIAYGIILLGFNLLFGYTGLLSFGHALFVAVGAYTVAILTSRLGIKNMEIIFLCAIGASIVVAVPVGLICVRYVRIFFGMLTLAFGMLFHSILFKFYDLSGGDSGIQVVRPFLFGQDLSSMDKTSFLIGPFFYYSIIILIILGALMWRIVHSPMGMHFRAIRDNSRKAEYLGIQVHRFRLIAFVISAIYGAIGGALLVIPVGLADPELAYWTHSGNIVFMTILGGFNNFFGPIVGAFAFIGLKDQLVGLTQYWRFALGIVLVMLVLLLPNGIMGLLQAKKRMASQEKAQ
ncbi:branched-chain amino acid ABC transporter permease [Polynucleobacter sp. 71A-WALBACH]|uniref:branched-chain amino acid ABC transporter permease n=1 Tax=Polynucleobacter sp. 71A-WALBACH TaxID=2689097 RepID=UPI001C0DC6DE|nr:branched-chain amino acid ABC transporter permease [Polynucleobacter sp. 71A-WALBACH]MBU3593412.1 branched-chain amino acid ABC transporter permease [Polynucleobacter sp. 71A-WALBACH]